MFKILQKSFRTGVVTKPYPKAKAGVSGNFRGLPEFDFAAWRDPRPAADACPTGAIVVEDIGSSRTATVDYGRCIFCGECAAADPAVHISRSFETAVTNRKDLMLTPDYPKAPPPAGRAKAQGRDPPFAEAVHGDSRS